MAGLTAWQSLFDAAGLDRGQSVLIHAAAGGVGHLAVQLAKWKGAHVIATCSKENFDFVRNLGADDTIDYSAMLFENLVHNLDVVLIPSADRREHAPGRRSSAAESWCRSSSRPRSRRPRHGACGRCSYWLGRTRNNWPNWPAPADDGKLSPFVQTVLPLSEAQKRTN